MCNQSYRGGHDKQNWFLVFVSMFNETKDIHVLASQVKFEYHVFYESFRGLPKKFKTLFLQKPPMDNLKTYIFQPVRLCT